MYQSMFNFIESYRIKVSENESESESVQQHPDIRQKIFPMVVSQHPEIHRDNAITDCPASTPSVDSRGQPLAGCPKHLETLQKYIPNVCPPSTERLTSAMLFLTKIISSPGQSLPFTPVTLKGNDTNAMMVANRDSLSWRFHSITSRFTSYESNHAHAPCHVPSCF